GVDEPGDRGVTQPCQQMTFALKALLTVAAQRRRMDELERDVPFEAAVRPPRSPDATHPATATLRVDDVRANLSPDEARHRRVQRQSRFVQQASGVVFEKPFLVENVDLSQKRLQLVRQVRILYAQL